jgi:predicted homoserine dehydrogenase-like protein
MILIDTALQARARAGRPIRVGVYGAGAAGRGFINQVTNAVPGMVIAAVSNRTIERAVNAYRFAEAGEPVVVSSLTDLDAAIAAGRPAVTDNPSLLAQSEQIDCLIDITGAVEFGAAIALEAIANGKHMVLMNAEVDATVGPILHDKARQAGVILTCVDGDQPGVQMNLYRQVKAMGFVPRVLGNVKGLQDEYRTPTTQQGFADQWNQDVTMVTSFADGSKVNVEQCVVANATGFTIERRGMRREDFTGHVDDLVTHYDLDYLRSVGGVVDFVIGTKPSPGVYCLAEQTDPRQRQYIELYKLGPGPLYSFYQPYHLCHFEAPFTIARAVLFGDICGQPIAGPVVEVVALAKRDLAAGEALESFGRYTTYGQAETEAIVRSERLLPQGLAAGCTLRRDIAKDQVISWDDVDAPSDQLAHQLYAEQQLRFPFSA